MMEIGADVGILTDDYYVHMRMGELARELDFPAIVVNHAVAEARGIEALAAAAMIPLLRPPARIRILSLALSGQRRDMNSRRTYQNSSATDENNSRLAATWRS